MFHVFTGIIALYVIARVVLPLPWGWTAKVLLAVILLLIAEHHLISRTLYGSMASPEAPTTVIIMLGWAFGAVLVLAMLLFISDIAGLLSYPFSARLGQALLSTPAWRYGLAVSALILAGIGVWEAIRVPRIKTIEVVMPRLPQELDGFRVVQLTDLHASKLLQTPWMEAVVAKTNALNPDLTVITGDLVDGTPEARDADMKPLQKLTARYGVLAIPGNHEYYVDYLSWLPAFDKLGLHMLLNQHVTIEHEGRKLVVAGITDRAAAVFGQPLPDVAAALDGASNDDPVILLSHRPVSAVDNANAGVDLQLSGHTHGGQILGAHLLTQWANEGFVSGLYQVNSMLMYVSNGTGLWSGLPIRLGRPSEITQIILRSGAGESLP
ncbi:metallophosphoesterase [Paenalcaligenes niemegkensis]|uniref:metallophosphoesterase n=1 Tax=Paenalcaligenes niemegkensis TaxID=2895469 RepID=UPI001EE8C4CE|nr:metallophosphoesterase [Paenalcaligenes niemegkensis]MCQ9618098.1 metallophosphoesterase [Paenalcaligenes niemegkensis]